MYGPGERDEIVKLWIQEGLADSTRVRYEKSWALWNMHLTTEGHGFNSFLDGVGREEFLKVLVLFIRSICLGSRGSKTALEISMSAVHSAFTQASKCTDLFRSDTVRLARKSSVKKTVAMLDYSDRNRKKLPCAFEMIAWVRGHYWVDKDWTTQVDSRMTYLGIAIAMDCLFRISEYALVPDSDYMIRCLDVAIELEGCSTTFQPGELKEALRQHGYVIKRIQLHIPRHRSKVAGSDRKIFLNWRGQDNVYGRQLIADFAEFCVREGGVGDISLFSRVRKGRTKHLSYDMVAQGVKRSAVAHGLNPQDFSTHSLRIGGATAMCAAGWSRSKIQQRGGWSELSDSDLIYALSLPSDSTHTSSVDRIVTIDDIRWLQVFHNNDL